jgi:hypothetical protein
MSIDNEAVSASRTIRMVEGPTGLAGERAIKVAVDAENPLFALEYGNDAGLRQKISDVEEPTILDGTEDGLSFATGKRGTQFKLRISASAADEYTVRVRVQMGGGWRAGKIIVKASA